MQPDHPYTPDDLANMRDLYNATDTESHWHQMAGFGYGAFVLVIGDRQVDFGFGGNSAVQFVEAAHRDMPRILDALEAAWKEVERLRGMLHDILSDGTGDIANPGKRLWPIRAAHYRRAKELLRGSDTGDSQ
jgi:hypothetical protein